MSQKLIGIKLIYIYGNCMYNELVLTFGIAFQNFSGSLTFKVYKWQWKELANSLLFCLIIYLYMPSFEANHGKKSGLCFNNLPVSFTVCFLCLHSSNHLLHGNELCCSLFLIAFFGKDYKVFLSISTNISWHIYQLSVTELHLLAEKFY